MFGKLSFAQTKPVIFEHITIDDGLSQGTVTSIFQDQKGFIWFGTHDGLNRYDGYNFKIFKHNAKDTHSVSSNWIEQIDQDKNGNLWIATDNGFNMYDRLSETFKNVYVDIPSQKKLLEGNRIYAILCDKYEDENVIWVGTVYGMVKYNADNRNFELFNPVAEPKEGDYVRCFAQDESGDIWVGTSESGIFKFKHNTNEFIQYKIRGTTNNSQSTGYITEIFIDSNTNVWLGTPGGLFKYNQTVDEFEQVKNLAGRQVPITSVTSISEDEKGVLYFGFVDNFSIYNKKKKSLKIFMNDPDDPRTISNSAMLSIHVDKSGIVWLGSNGYGINRINPSRNNFYLYTHQRGKPQVKSIRSFCEDGYGNIWIGGYRGLEKIDKDSGILYYYYMNNNQEPPEPFPSIYSLCSDKDYPDDIIWMGTEGGGILKYNITTGKIEPLPLRTESADSSLGKFISDIYDDGKGNLWIGNNKGLGIYNKTRKTIRTFIHSDGDSTTIGPKLVNCVFEDSFGRMWLGTNYGGINLFDKENGTFKHFFNMSNDPHNQSKNNVKVIFEDREKKLWFGTSGSGLVRFDPNKNTFKTYSIDDGLPNDVIYGILEDSNHNLWLSTNLGLCRFNYKTMHIRNYNVEDGLQSNEFNSNAYFKSSAGEMFFGGINGFNSFFPEQLSENKYVPPIVVTNFYLFNEKVPINKPINEEVILTKSMVQTDTIELSHNNNILTFEFAALDFTSPQLNKYVYKLEGFNKDWVQSGESRLANYTNLDPGTYVFRVKGSNNDGIWNETGASIVIIIAPPYWSTWWFKLLGIVAFVFVMYGLYEFRLLAERKRSEQLEKEVEQRTEELKVANEMLRKDAMMLEETNASKDKLFSIISHDLKNPFQSLLGYTEWLIKDYPNFSDDEKRRIINNIRESSVNIYNLLVRLLEWSRLQTSRTNFEPIKIDLKNFVDSIIQILRVSLENKQITVVNEIDYNVFVYADENMLNSVLQNLLSNAVKFSYENSIIIISYIANEEFVAVSVTDSGVGMTEDVIQKLFKTGIVHTTSGTKNEQGTGFGLLLCKELVEMNGGTIWAESENGKGSSFKFTVPKSNNHS